MPELPDVEGFRRIDRVEVADTGVLHGVTARRLRSTLQGRVLGTPERHGKWLLAPTEDGPALLLHFGMTGRLDCRPAGERAHRHDRVLLTLGDDRLCYRDQRKLKGLWYAPQGADDDVVRRTLAGQGPDAAGLSRTELDGLLGGRRGGVKSVLLDQSAVAGLGNLLADEILWRARLRPGRRAAELTPAERRTLHTELRRTLRPAMRAGRVPDRPSWLTGHRDDPDGRCPRCSGTLRRDRIAGRATVWCPHCQR
ncbi:Fpg/Nei family DNA glycosylase [Streptomyces sp. JJ36]|uniref:Fpg/Nei family DNA glycosylase n=1 Tax=Streptomyces sp. JJ36 TaxID=2736645 RepID=UPI001F430668|nr:DNA-formamidopyrimidine glycosylase family protein [Streptomyces sp. JJ36]MCF6523174.1 Fpg/Nei family DNA glycosylase [Streptomyces sp. JJ36]